MDPDDPDPDPEEEETAWELPYRDCWFAGDHLGNVRSVIDISLDQSAPQILEQSDYLPFGTKISNPNLISGMNNRWRYAGKEEQRFGLAGAFSPIGNAPFSGTGFLDLSLLDFGARMYDPFAARWTAKDPLAFKSPSSSTYSYCYDNPISYFDPIGLEGVKEVTEDGSITIHSNIVVLLEKMKEIPNNASEKVISRIERKNARIERRNEARMATIREYLSEEFSKTATSEGTPVVFSFNIIPLEVSNPSNITTSERYSIANNFGIHGVVTPDRKEGVAGAGVALAAIIGQGGSGDALGLTSGKTLITMNDFSSRTLAHEIGHTFGLRDNYPSEIGSLMDYPAKRISALDVDTIIKKAYVKKN